MSILMVYNITMHRSGWIHLTSSVNSNQVNKWDPLPYT